MKYPTQTDIDEMTQAEFDAWERGLDFDKSDAEQDDK